MAQDGGYGDWIGRSETRAEIACAAPLEGLAALLDHETLPWAEGLVPPLGHWLYFLPRAPQSQIDVDGHPKRGGFTPPIPLPRRMWAGGRVDLVAPIRVGAPMERRTTILSVTEKTGGSGRMVFLTLRQEVFADGVLAVDEEQDIVYREAASGPQAPPPAEPDPRRPERERRIEADPAALVRCSALTFNAHRIHYDRDYARDVEGYPGLVAHGPYQAMLLMDHFLRGTPRAQVRRFEFRARRPLFDVAPFDLCLLRGAGGADLWTRGPDGAAAMTARVEALG